MRIHRRDFLRIAASTSLGFGGLRRALAGGGEDSGGDGEATKPRRPRPEVEHGFGPLIEDPAGVMDLPSGFSYRIISSAGEPMSDKLLVPGAPDGMGAFSGARGRVILVRNHELRASSRFGAFGPNNERLHRISSSAFYDFGQSGEPSLGGTTTIIYNPRSRKVERQFLSLVGTERNCAGGPTPWGTWLSCEELTVRAGTSRAQDHGYVFEVQPQKWGSVSPRPLVALGRFLHEAAAVDPATSAVYMTEDLGSGLLYRFLPDAPGRLELGGRLQALVIIGMPGLDTDNHNPANQIPVATVFDVDWVDLDDVQSPNNNLRIQGRSKGAAVFSRGEGIWYGNNEMFFCATSGGLERRGQVWRLTPGPDTFRLRDAEMLGGQLELFVEPNDVAVMDKVDNITVSPFGDLIVCEDGAGPNHILGITSAGQIYKIARNALNSSELTGVVFSPNGETLFVNIQRPGHTIAIEGPW